MTALECVFVAVAGIVAGIANTMAGGGSLLTIPMLTFVGVPAMAANATLRPALVAQNVSALIGYRRTGALAAAEFPWRATLVFAACAIPGAVAGAWFAAARVDDRTFERILAVVMVACATLATRRRAGRDLDPTRVALPAAAAGFVLIGLYGGFIQAGVGFVIITALCAATGWSMAVINAVKVTVVLCYTIPAVLVFGGFGLIDWFAAAILMVGHAAGGLLGSRLVSRADDQLLMRIYLFAVIVFAIKLAF